MDYYGRQGRPMPRDRWESSDTLGSEEYRRIGRTEIGDVVVSTVWLGLDHRLGEDGPPLIFETMVFGGELDDTCERYSTEAEAKAGHDRLVTKVRESANGGAS